MSKRFTYTKSTFVNAPVARVWAVLTDPICIPKFYFGMDWKTDWQKGSSIVFSGDHDHQYFEDKGNILDIEKEKFILFNYFNPEWEEEDLPENYKVFRFEVEAKNNETIFTVFEYNFINEEAFASIKVKWDSVLYTVKQEAEKK
ncbi:MAG: SRPBCC domain-containing protein [Bacteroidetes bacterium]|nr:SRPBCC domain-containing protein [Bacteroidota bacterium]